MVVAQAPASLGEPGILSFCQNIRNAAWRTPCRTPSTGTTWSCRTWAPWWAGWRRSWARCAPRPSSSSSSARTCWRARASCRRTWPPTTPCWTGRRAADGETSFFHEENAAFLPSCPMKSLEELSPEPQSLLDSLVDSGWAEKLPGGGEGPLL
ncbi:uncharacterized protein LOC128591817 [Nycticebus coucang]|uniref:uncharacterized protein LOC128591817 n=1 Tax=Nycticebus coucang TaxID=9470 RepID=UPI00234C9DAB|nr:uncharacterized protein LOC128591817 [Nycticebus coucang]